jgi:hypothetical protein
LEPARLRDVAAVLVFVVAVVVLVIVGARW